ncbi:MAG: NMD3-related protein [Nanoarchaeota archaeon]
MVRNPADKHDLYYEATLQLRDVTEEMVDFAYAEIQRVGMRISKEISFDNGIDFRLTDKSLTRSLGKKLQATFGGEYKETVRIYGQKDGAEIYRLTILFRGMGAKKGEVVRYHGEEYKIVLIGKDMLLQEVHSGKKIHVKYGEAKNFKEVG